MDNKKAKQEAKRSLMSGFRHHDFEAEQRIMSLLLRDGSIELDNSTISLNTYADVLAPTPFRAMQNGVICLITVVSRIAIKLGVDSEQSFALSDYFVCEVERKRGKSELEMFVREVFLSFSEAVHSERVRSYSLPITRAVNFISAHLYEPCAIGELAKYVGLNPRYFSTLFKKEVEVTPTQFVRGQKMAEAAALLKQGDYSVTEIAEMFGYCSLAHFSSEFKSEYGQSPKNYIRSPVNNN